MLLLLVLVTAAGRSDCDRDDETCKWDQADQPAATAAAAAATASQLTSGSGTKHLDLVTFGEAMLTYKPAPPATCNDTPLTTGASLVVQAVGGAELNTAVAASLVGKKAAWASVLPAGPLGKIVIDAAAAAGLELAAPYVRFEANGATVGTVHVVDDGAGPRPHYQRSHSAFGRMLNVSTFDWGALLRPAKWLHVTGITPPLGAGPLAAWQMAMRAAGPAGALVSLDLNWRPALGPFDALWALVLPELRHVTLLILSEADLVRLGCTERLYPMQPDGAPTPPALLGADALCAVLSALRERWGVPLLACTFKRPLDSSEAQVPAASTSVAANTVNAGGNRRFSAVAHGLGGRAAGCECTAETSVEHHPVQALGGGDAWVAGFLSRLTEVEGGDAANTASANAALRLLAFTPEALRAACRTGDLLAALAQQTHGDFSSVSRLELDAAEREWAGRTAVLPPPCAVVVGGGGGGEGARQRSQAEVVAAMGAARLVPVVVVPEAAAAAELGRALLAGGVTVVEVVLRTAAAEEALERMAREVPQLIVGAGTVLSVAQAARAVAAGAQFIVAPGLNPEVVRWCLDRGVAIVPGVATPTEMERAMGLGLTHLKFFPAETLGGTSALKAFAAPYGALRFMPTGGVTRASMGSYLALPCVLCVGGSWIVPQDALKARDFARITQIAADAVAAALASK